MYNNIVHTVVESTTYLRSIEHIWSEDDAGEFVDFIAINPDAGDVIRGTNGLRKIRWGRAGMGKRGGVRVIYLWRNAREDVLLVIAYTKAKFDNLPVEFLVRLKEHYDV